jgi:hypothetical protein
MRDAGSHWASAKLTADGYRTGFERGFIGSWKIIVMREPRTSRGHVALHYVSASRLRSPRA